MARKHRSKDQIKEIDALVERLREFVRLNYTTATEVARQIGRKGFGRLFVASGRV